MRLTCDHVPDQLFVGVSALQLRLPSMSMCVDKARTDDLVSAIYNFDAIVCGDVFCNLCYLAMLDQNARLSRNNMIASIMYESNAVSQKDTHERL